jgi:hypothetical protein
MVRTNILYGRTPKDQSEFLKVTLLLVTVASLLKLRRFLLVESDDDVDR